MSRPRDMPVRLAGAQVLVVDDEPAVLAAVARMLSTEGYRVRAVEGGAKAIAALQRGVFDVVVSDVTMPGLDGMSLLRSVRETDLDLPVILMTGDPSAETAIEAIRFGAHSYLSKPLDPDKLRADVHRALKLHEIARLRRRAQEQGIFGDRAGLEVGFRRALQRLFMAFQPVVRWSERSILGWEALVRSEEPTLPHPGALLDAAERLGLLDALGRTIRPACVEPWSRAPSDALLFVNLHTRDLLDPQLYEPTSPLSTMADRVVLEVTERACLDEVDDAPQRIADLRSMGFRIAVDDIGAGYAGLTSFAALEPDFLKLDVSIVRAVHLSSVKAKLIGSFVSLCADLGIGLIAEGVETEPELEALIELGCDLFQGFLFARPGPPFPHPTFEPE